MDEGRFDFTSSVKDFLRKQSGYRCSNPSCRVHLLHARLPHQTPANIGDVAHIYAASPGGPRFNPSLDENDIRHHDNGIYLCKTCHVIVDSCENLYPDQLLFNWKNKAHELNTPSGISSWDFAGHGRTLIDDCNAVAELITDLSPHTSVIYNFLNGCKNYPNKIITHELVNAVRYLSMGSFIGREYVIISEQFRSKVVELKRLASEIYKRITLGEVVTYGFHYIGDEPSPFPSLFPNGTLVFIDSKSQSLNTLYKQILNLMNHQNEVREALTFRF